MQGVKRLPNIISVLRIVISLCFFAAMLNKAAFIVLFSLAGATDVIDGFLARKLNAVSELGARLDSISDIAFFVCGSIAVLYMTEFNLTLIIGAAAITFIRLLNVIFFRLRFKKFGGIHTIGNKLSGLIVFALLLYAALTTNIILHIVIPLFSLNFLFAIEETILIFVLKENDFNKKSIFSVRKPGKNQQENNNV